MKNYNSMPPKIGQWILKNLLSLEERKFFLEDIEEAYSMMLSSKGYPFSLFWYWKQLIKTIPVLLADKINGSTAMFINYLKIGIRNILKQKLYSFINITGLSIGLACCLMIMIWVQYEMSFDKFHQNYDNLYRIITDWEYNGRKTTETLNPMPLGDELKNNYPEITHSTRYMEWSQFGVEYDDKIRFDLKVGFVDQDFIEMFSFPLMSGNPENCLLEKNSAVLTEKTANYYFGNDDPIGKTIIFENNDKKPLNVTGIIKDPPDNSHMQFDMLVHIYNLSHSEEWDSQSWGTYILSNKEINADSFEDKIAGLYETHSETQNIGKMKSRLQPMEDIHMRSGLDDDSSNYYMIDIKDMYIFISIAVIVFVIACINFMCMATARSVKREKEVGVRKISGALRSDLIKQFMGESFILVLFSLFSALIIVYIFLPAFNDISGKEINFSLLNKWHLLISVGLFTLITAFLSGSYPALFLSSIKPVRLFHGKSEGKTKGVNLRKSLVTLQYSFTIVLLIASMVLFRQLSFISSKDLGYDHKDIITLGLHGNAQRIESIRSELLKHKNVINVSKGALPSYGDKGHPTNRVDWEGKTSDQLMNFDWLGVYYDYDKIFKLNIKEGRFFSREHPSDTSNYVLNETAIREMGIDDPIGKRFSLFNTEGVIVGVIEDIHVSSLRAKIKPTVFTYSIYFGMNVRIQPENQDETIKHLQSVWEKFEPVEPFSYRFYDERINRMYANERKTGTIIRYFTVLAIVVFFLGLFGLIGFISEQRTKEIGIRKVLGASISGITAMVYKDFIKLLLYASVFSFPVGYYFSINWLENYAYRFNLNIWIFVLTFIFIFAFTFVIIFYQTIKVARLNPVDSLRYE